MKRFLSLLIAFIMVMSTGTMAFAGPTDYENSWAKKEIDYMKEKGILQGDQNGNFKPNNQIRKSEFYRVINGLIGYQGKADNVFSDVNSSDWFFEEVEKGLAAKYLSGGQVLNARDNITREEVARIIGFVFDVEENKKAAEFFEDSDLIKDELKGIIGGLRANGFINGFPDATFRPTIEIKRSDVVKMLYDISGQIINEAGKHSMDAKGNVVVNTEDVVLEDMTIEGNLYLTEGIGEGDVTLDKVTVKGEVIVKGGGANSVIIKNSIINKISVDKQEGLVRVVFENTRVEQVTTAREVKVELTEGSKIQEVKLDGKVELVAEEGTSIETIDATSKEVTITSKGNIGTIKTTQDIKVNNKEVKAKEEAKVEGGKAPEVTKKAPAAKPTTPTASTTGGGGGGGGGGYIPSEPGTPTPTPRPDPTPIEPVTPTPVLVRTITVTGKDNVVMGETLQLKATVGPENASNKVVEWSVTTLDGGNATIDQKGLLTASVAGTVTVKATANDGSGLSKEFVVTITAKPLAPAVTSVTVAPKTASVVQGKTQQLTATVVVVDGAAKTVNWTSSHGKVTVSAEGLVTVAADAPAGDYTITATSTVDGSKLDTAVITVTEAAPLAKAVLSSQASGAGMPTSKVTVKIDGVEILAYDLYFDGGLLASTTNGTVTIATAVVNNPARVTIKVNGETYEVQ